jgi:probable F420-dependent oxidoreductase
MKFSTGFPGLMHYPPEQFPPGGGNWQEKLTTEDFQLIARTAEELGYDSINTSEHLVMPKDLVDAMGAHWPDAFTVMSFIAGATTRIAVNSAVIVMPYHEPIAFAKAVSTLDLLSSGRVMLTLGVGMARGEFAALGVPFEKRGRVMDEYIAAMKVLWSEDDPSFQGEFVAFEDIVFEPKPVQKPHPPLWIGGSSMAALRRAARVGDGWTPSGSQGGKGPWLNGVDDLPMFLEEARRIPGFAEREHEFGISLTPVTTRFGPNHEPLPGDRPLDGVQDLVDRIGALQEAGVTWTSIPRPGPPAQSLADHLEGLEWAATEVMARFR